MEGAALMARGGARPGAGRKAKDRPTEFLATLSLTLRLSDLGVLNRLGHGNYSLGLRRLIDLHRSGLAAVEANAGEPNQPARTAASADAPNATKSG